MRHSFAIETFLTNPGDYSFLYTGDPANLTARWWLTGGNGTENGMYGQKGMSMLLFTMLDCFDGNSRTEVKRNEPRRDRGGAVPDAG